MEDFWHDNFMFVPLQSCALDSAFVVRKDEAKPLLEITKAP